MQKPKQNDALFIENRSQASTNVKLMKIFVAQYLLSEGFKKAQEHGINLLTDLLIKYIKKIGVKVKRITQLQGRNEANIFQLLFEVDTNLKIPLNSILDYISEQKQSTAITTNPSSPHPENFFITNLIDEIYGSSKSQQQEEEREYSNIITSEDNNGIDSIGNRSIEDVKNIKTLSESRPILKLLNACLPTLPKSHIVEEAETMKESDIKLLKAQQKRYFVSQILRIRRPIEEINSKRKHQAALTEEKEEQYDNEDEDDYEGGDQQDENMNGKEDDLDTKSAIKKKQKTNTINSTENEQEEKKPRESAMNPFGVPSRKVKEIKIEDFIV